MLETTQSQIKCTFIFRILPSLYVEGRNGILFNNVDRLAHLIRKIVKADFFEISTPFVEFLSQVKLKSLIFFSFNYRVFCYCSINHCTMHLYGRFVSS